MMDSTEKMIVVFESSFGTIEVEYWKEKDGDGEWVMRGTAYFHGDDLLAQLDERYHFYHPMWLTHFRFVPPGWGSTTAKLDVEKWVEISAGTVEKVEKTKGE